jgi:hypothetical protein
MIVEDGVTDQTSAAWSSIVQVASSGIAGAAGDCTAIYEVRYKAAQQ